MSDKRVINNSPDVLKKSFQPAQAKVGGQPTKGNGTTPGIVKPTPPIAPKR